MNMLPEEYKKNEEIIDQVKESWIKVFSFLEYNGFNKEKSKKDLNQKFGQDDWVEGHFFSGQVVPKTHAYKEYDEAYYEFFKKNPKIRNWIQKTASEVIDYAVSNIESGLNLTHQEGKAIHLQDIAVRRALTRLKLDEKGINYNLDNLPKIKIFQGDHIVQIRDKNSEGYILNPGQIPFHKPKEGIGKTVKSWWMPNSIEDIYQRNKVLLVNPNSLKLGITLLNGNNIYLGLNKSVWLKYNQDSNDELHRLKGKSIRRQASNNCYNGYCEIVTSPKIKYPNLVTICQKYINRSKDIEEKKLTYETFIKKLE